MPLSSRGLYSLPHVPAEALAHAPEPVRAAYDLLVTQNEKRLALRAESNQIRNSLNALRSADEVADAQAVAAGKPLPEPKAPAEQQRADLLLREANGIEQVLAADEEDFWGSIAEHRDAWADACLLAAETAQQAAVAALAAADEALAAFASTADAWNSLRGGRMPSGARAVNCGNDDSHSSLLDRIGKAVDRTSPEGVLAEEARVAAEVEAQRAGREVTADGLVLR